MQLPGQLQSLNTFVVFLWEYVKMYIVRNYLTNEVVAMCSRKEDAIAMVRSTGTRPDDPKLIYEKG